jgi:hypothetical protein
MTGDLADRLQHERAGGADLADRVALRELVDLYAYSIDRRQPRLFATLFPPDGQLIVTGRAGTRPLVLDGRDGWVRAFTVVAPFTVTSHFVGNHLVRTTGDQAGGETYCLVHEVYRGDGDPRIQVRLVRYEDAYVRRGGRWLFQTRVLRIDWHDDRVLGPARDPYRETGAGSAEVRP